ncbi:MAG: ABC transporter ATP-binding protein [Oscillospiraceae bacterium]|nr:ABC transporter ATP-binding protein [Oscillospiraceae bacterium]
MNEAILTAEALSVGYRGQIVVADISFEARRGQILTLIGPNGAGKSTILKTLNRQLEPISGHIRLGGQELKSIRERDIARSMAAVLTGRPKPELMTCRDVVSSGRYPYTGRLGILSADDRRKTAEAMELVRVTDLADRDFEQISDGQRQRVMLARAICQEPRVLIMDEPTSFLDIRHKLDFLSLLRSLARDRKIAVVLSLHELDLAQRFSDLVLCIRGGAVDFKGTPEDVFSGDYIERLYELEPGRYDPLFGSIEGLPAEGVPRVFVIGGGGMGIALYRRLQRLGIPFAAGIIPENDLDYPVARALASKLISVPAFSAVDSASVSEAKESMLECGGCFCALSENGRVDKGAAELLSFAREHGILRQPENLDYLLAE